MAYVGCTFGRGEGCESKGRRSAKGGSVKGGKGGEGVTMRSEGEGEREEERREGNRVKQENRKVSLVDPTAKRMGPIRNDPCQPPLSPDTICLSLPPR